MSESLTTKQIRILTALSIATDWITRDEMIPIAGHKGYSEALGSPTTGIRADSLEARGFVERRDDRTPFHYRITQAGREILDDGSGGILTKWEVLKAKFEHQVNQSASDSSELRRQRLASAPKQPTKVSVWSYVFRRNPDVVAEVLFRASGFFEGCGSQAPFLRNSDGTPYLEVHHHKRLADGGEDTIENALALCPNCHRKAHHGS